jgi:hypothetical protein
MNCCRWLSQWRVAFPVGSIGCFCSRPARRPHMGRHPSVCEGFRSVFGGLSNELLRVAMEPPALRCPAVIQDIHISGGSGGKLLVHYTCGCCFGFMTPQTRRRNPDPASRCAAQRMQVGSSGAESQCLTLPRGKHGLQKDPHCPNLDVTVVVRPRGRSCASCASTAIIHYDAQIDTLARRNAEC